MSLCMNLKYIRTLKLLLKLILRTTSDVLIHCAVSCAFGGARAKAEGFTTPVALAPPRKKSKMSHLGHT